MKRRMPDNKLQDALLHTLATFEHFDPETEALFLGSSHTVYGFAPKNCRHLRAWNAGFNSGDLKMAYYTYQALRDKWPKQPGQCVVISEDFFMNSTRCEFSSEFYQPLLLSQFSAFRFDNSFRLAPHRDAQMKIFRFRDFLRHHPDWSYIPDPYYEGHEGFELVLDLVEDGCQTMLDKILRGEDFE